MRFDNRINFTMEERKMKSLDALLKKPSNSTCADCGSSDIEYASYNIGVFLCPQCARIHEGMGSHISKVKHLKLDFWEDSQIERLKEVGNNNARHKYEQRVPPAYRRPKEGDPIIVAEQWIFSKYYRQEFTTGDKHMSYLSGQMEGFLMKKGREDPRYFPRKFVLDGDGSTLRYYVKEHKNPKAVIPLKDLSLSLCPRKLDHEHSIQLSYMKDGSTRHIYVYHDDSEVIMQWYQALRIAMLQQLKTAWPSSTEQQLLSYLPEDAILEGWLTKAGPTPAYAHRRRWFTLANRKLMYHIDPLDAYPKGEIFLGTSSENSFRSSEEIEAAATAVGIQDHLKSALGLGSYKVSLGGFGMDDDSTKASFSLHTPYRTFIFAADTQSERDRWAEKISEILKSDILPTHIVLCASLVRKRNGMNPLSLLTGR